MPTIEPANQDPEFLLYQTSDGVTRIAVRLEDETVWLSQAQMAELFQTTKQNISLHIRNVFEEGELEEPSVVKQYLTTADDGKKYSVNHYNLDVIISVGYRVRSHRGTQFRMWATQRLREYIVKGFALDEAKLKEQATITDYFDELLAKIRDIRSTEKLLYKRVREICALSVDYVAAAEEAQAFFATVQNKLLHAVTGHTAAEIVQARADSNAPNMGLQAWSGDVVRKKDVTVSKNYLRKEEIEPLNLLVAQFLDFAELQANQKRELRMGDWLVRLDQILDINEMPVLTDKGRVSAKISEEHAHLNYAVFEERRRLAKEQELEDEADVVTELSSEIKALDHRRKQP
jgi:hypothetical protein